MDIVTRNFRKKPFREDFSKILCNPRLSSSKTCEIWPYFLQFFSGYVLRWKSSHNYFRMLFAPRWGGTSINKSQKKDMGRKGQNVLFSENRFFSLSVWDLLHPTPWVFWSEILTRHPSLCLLSFGWYLSPRLVPQDSQCIFYSSLPGLKGWFVRVWNCLILLLGEYSSVSPEICRVLSQIQWTLFHENSGKNHFGRIFQKFCATKAIL